MSMGKHLYLSKRTRAVVEVWSPSRKKRTAIIDCYDKISLNRPSVSETQCAITSLVVQSMTSLWVGTHGGLVALVDTVTMSLVSVFHRHVYAVRALVVVPPSSCPSKACHKQQHNDGAEWAEFPGGVVTGGGGYRNILGTSPDMGDEYGFVTVWNLDVRQQVREAEELARKRRHLLHQS